MICAEFEQGLARLMAGDASGGERERLLSGMREHAAACDECRGSEDLVDLLAAPEGRRDLVEEPGEDYWSTFEARLGPKLKAAPGRSWGRWWAVAAAVALLALLAGWMLRGPAEAPAPALVADAGTGPTSVDASRTEFPPSLVESLGQATAAEVENQLAAFEEWGEGWGAHESGGGEEGAAVWEGGLFPELDRLDVPTRERLLDWLRDENRRLEGAKG